MFLSLARAYKLHLYMYMNFFCRYIWRGACPPPQNKKLATLVYCSEVLSINSAPLALIDSGVPMNTSGVGEELELVGGRAMGKGTGEK